MWARLVARLADEAGWIRRPLGTVIVAVTVGITGTSIIVREIDGGGEPPAGTANAWVDTNGGTCAYSSSPVAYSDASACGSIDAAWDQLSAGNTARIVDGNYTSQQVVTGDKASDTFVIGESRTGVVFENVSEASNCRIPPVCSSANHMWLENVTLDTTGHRDWGNGSYVDATNVTFRNVDILGEAPSVHVAADNFTYWGGTIGDSDPPNDCEESGDGKIQTEFTPSNLTIDGVKFNPVDVDVASCPGAHKESIRLQDALDNVVIRNNWFVVGSDVGSGHIFCGGTAGTTNAKIVNNYFAPVNGTYWIQCGNGSGWNVSYNTFEQDATFGTPSTVTWVGNLGEDEAFTSCSGTHTKNVWGGSGSCGTDTFVGGTNLEIDSSGHIGATSPAIDAAETPGASDYCTDAAYVNSLDRDGDSRPQGSVCDAGSDER